MWSALEEGRKTSRVSWDNICKSKKEGGLGVKDLEAFNVTLLSKWKWRCISNRKAIWRDLFDFDMEIYYLIWRAWNMTGGDQKTQSGGVTSFLWVRPTLVLMIYLEIIWIAWSETERRFYSGRMKEMGRFHFRMSSQSSSGWWCIRTSQ